jgi:hypothetical protein
MRIGSTGFRSAAAAIAAAAVALSAAPTRAELTAQTPPEVTARMAPPVFTATSTGPPLGIMFARVSASPAVDAQGLLGNEKADVFMAQQSPGVYMANGAPVMAWWTPATLYWQAQDRSCLRPQVTPCTSQVVPFQVKPLPAPVMVSPADGAQMRSGTKINWTIRDVPSYAVDRALAVEFSLSPRLATSGLFAQPLTLQFPMSAPSWLQQSSTAADGTGTAQTLLGGFAGLFHKRIYWHVYRRDCFAEPDCVVTDGQVRSVIITPVPDPHDPTANPDARVLFRHGLNWPNQKLLHRPKAKILIGYVIMAADHAKRTVGDLRFALNVHAMPFRGTMRVTIRLGGRTRVLYRKRYDLPGDPDKYWARADIVERVKLSRRVRAAIIAALKRHRRVAITGTLNTADLAGHPERHVTHDHYTLSLPRR